MNKEEFNGCAFIIEDSLPEESVGKCFREYLNKIEDNYGIKPQDLIGKMGYSPQYEGWVFELTAK